MDTPVTISVELINLLHTCGFTPKVINDFNSWGIDTVADVLDMEDRDMVAVGLTRSLHDWLCATVMILQEQLADPIVHNTQ